MDEPGDHPQERRSTAGAIISVVRLPHMVKNLVVLLPVIFAVRMGDVSAWRKAGLAALAFCLVSSGMYVFNDIRDRRGDRHHPQKKNRPIAAGHLGLGTAWITCLVLLGLGAVLAWVGARGVSVFLAAYVLLGLGYSLGLKHKMLLDVIIIAAGFVMRAAAGAVAIQVVISPWLVVCTFTLCLFMGFCKRYSEVVTLAGESGAATRHRPTLGGYTPELLTHLITLSAAIAIISFLLYATAKPMSYDRFEKMGLLYTLPLVIYGVCRFAMLSMRGRHADPVEIILHDRPFQATVVLWTALAAVVILWADAIQTWVTESLYP
ncbi:MAG TPA: decaprenyl-phosphate phosphoribosyltransferase [Phycisphaerae bacterium]|nr:decaprenyl-phosphate phosphoribosyltransferase [Phycisphaerae bacterium]